MSLKARKMIPLVLSILAMGWSSWAVQKQYYGSVSNETGHPSLKLIARHAEGPMIPIGALLKDITMPDKNFILSKVGPMVNTLITSGPIVAARLPVGNRLILLPINSHPLSHKEATLISLATNADGSSPQSLYIGHSLAAELSRIHGAQQVNLNELYQVLCEQFDGTSEKVHAKSEQRREIGNPAK